MDSDYSCDYAYIKKKTNEISTVDISLIVGNKNLNVLIKSFDDYYVIDELEEILKELQKHHLSRMKVDLFDECDVYLDNIDAFRKVTFVGRTFKIDKIEEVERF